MASMKTANQMAELQHQQHVQARVAEEAECKMTVQQ